MLGFKSFRSARIILSGIELMHDRERTNADGRGTEALSRRAVLRPCDISVPITSLSYPYERGTLRNAQAVGSYERRLQALAKVPLLIIDDIGLTVNPCARPKMKTSTI